MEKCQNYRCINLAAITCKCFGQLNFFCEFHIADHIKIPGDTHKTCHISNQEQNKELITSKTIEYIEKLNEIQNQLEEEKKKLISEITNDYDTLIWDLAEKRFKLEKILISNFNCGKKDYFSKLSQKTEKEIKEEVQKWDLPHKHHRDIGIEEKISKYLVMEDNYAPVFREMNNMIIAEKKINTIDIKCLKFSENVENSDSINISASFLFSCQISDNLVFCAYGADKRGQVPTMNHYFLYNFSKSELIKLRKLQKDCRNMCGTVYTNKEIFIFGGLQIPNKQIDYDNLDNDFIITSRSPLDSVIRFKLSSNEIEKLSVCMPQASETTACVINSEIYLTGLCMNKVYKFSANDLKFEDLGLNVRQYTRKVLLAYKNQIYLISGDDLLRKSGKRQMWKQIGTVVLLSLTHVQSHVIREKFIYFTDGKTIWRLDTETGMLNLHEPEHKSYKFKYNEGSESPSDCYKKIKICESYYK